MFNRRPTKQFLKSIVGFSKTSIHDFVGFVVFYFHAELIRRSQHQSPFFVERSYYQLEYLKFSPTSFTPYSEHSISLRIDDRANTS